MAKADAALFKPELVFFDIEADDANALFDALYERLREAGYVRESWPDAIRERERDYPTGLLTPTAAVAIPHVDPAHIERPYIAVIKPPRPVTFEFMAGMGDPVPAELIVNLGITRDGGQVQVLQELMNLFQDEDAVADIMAQTTGEGMVSAIAGRFDE